MTETRLQILCLSGFPPSPATFGAQRRIQGLLASLARRHAVTVLSLAPPEYDTRSAERAMRAYCEPHLVAGLPSEGRGKRRLQLRSLVSRHTFEHHHLLVPTFVRRVAELLEGRRFDVVQLEAPSFTALSLRRAPAGSPSPKVVLDAHNIEYDLARQMATDEHGPVRRLYHEINWRKYRVEELASWRASDGIAFTSELDRSRALQDVPSLVSTVVPNAVDVEYFRPRPEDPPADGRTVLFFGMVDYFPNRDGLGWFLREVWPLVESRHPGARLKIVGPRPTAEVLAARGPRVEVTGLVDDLRPHLARAAMTIVPLRIGGGTRLKVVEALAMGKPIVSTSLGAEGIDVTHERNILLADDPAAFANAIGRILDAPDLGRRLGREARALAVDRYSWDAAADDLEAFYLQLLGRPRATVAAAG